jgi:hypothetical protein
MLGAHKVYNPFASFVYFYLVKQKAYSQTLWAIVSIMIRPLVLIILTTISVQGQDSTLVKEFCNNLTQFSQTNDINSQLSRIADISERYTQGNPTMGDNPLQDRIRFQYRLMRALKRDCPSYSIDRVRLIPKSVLDLEDKLTKQEIDSLTTLTSQIKQKNKAYLYVVTVDDFYPDSTIIDFSNRYRDYWGPQAPPEKGVVLIVFTITQRQLRISTGEISMQYLTDDESSEVIKLMIPYLKDDKYFEGLVTGLLEIQSRL